VDELTTPPAQEVDPHQPPIDTLPTTPRPLISIRNKDHIPAKPPLKLQHKEIFLDKSVNTRYGAPHNILTRAA
jgi:hypothetical protein